MWGCEEGGVGTTVMRVVRKGKGLVRRGLGLSGM